MTQAAEVRLRRSSPLVLSVLLLGAVAGAAAAQRPVLVVAAVTAALGVVWLLARPDGATVVAAALLYGNVMAVAVRTQGVPVSAANTVALILLLPLATHLLLRREPLVLNATIPLLALFFVVQSIGAIRSVDPLTAWGHAQDYLTGGLLLYLAFLNVVRSARVLRQVIWTVLAVGAGLGALSVYQAATGAYANDFFGFAQVAEVVRPVNDPTPTPAVPRLAGPIGEKNYYAQIMVALLPLGMMMTRVEPRLSRRLCALVAMVFIALGATMTYSRGAAVGLLLTILMMAALGHLRAATIAALAVSVLVLLSLFPRYLERFAEVGGAVAVLRSEPGPETDEAVLGRLGENLAAVRVIARQPLIGVGPGMFGLHYREQAVEVGVKVKQGTRAAHNMYLGIAAEAGLVGFMLFVGAVALTLRMSLLVGRRLPRGSLLQGMVVGTMLAIVAYCASGIFLSLAYERYFWFLMALAAAATAVGQQELRRQDAAPSPPPTAQTPVPALR